ncbi:MAG: ABC transporter ATP-binding protein [Candidatus Hydrogenedentes bacterium]|nr:ABC transporter ATP-binding protein [Candidatus Hydrogenedentota bacterium]
MYGIDENTNYEERNVAKPKGDSWSIYKRLLGYVLEYKARLALSVVLAFFVALSLGGIVVFAGSVVTYTFSSPGEAAKQLADDTASINARVEDMRAIVGWAPSNLDQMLRDAVGFLREEGRQTRAMVWLCTIVILLALIGGLSRFGQEYLCASIATFITVRLGLEMFDNIIRLPIRFFEKHTSGEIIARMTNDCFTAGRGLTAVFMKLFREPFKAIVFFTIAFSAHAPLTIIGLGVLPPVVLIMIKIGQKVRKSMRRTLERIAGLQTVSKESVAGISIIKGFLMEDFVRSLVRREYAKLQRQGLKMMRADAAIGPLTEFVMTLGFVVFIVISVYEVTKPNPSLRVDDLLKLYLSLAMMLDPVRKLTAVNNAVQTSVASAERVFEFIDLKPDIVDAPDAVTLKPLREIIRFEDVHFSYDGKTEVLRGVTFDVKKGEMIAIVGFSGAGKSTLAKLVPRFYDVTGGSISIDGVDIRKATQSSLRAQISIVTQDTILFNASVRENIAAGNDSYSDDRIKQAVKAAHATEFVEKLYRQYETVIGESGGSLSGGQRQRLAIARALIKDPAILILDEATSSLDMESERAIQKAIEEFVVGRTSIVIAHRLSTVQRADRILVLDQGRVVEQGKHEELLQRPDSLYRTRLYGAEIAPAAEEEASAGNNGSDTAAALPSREDAVY